MSQEEEAPGRRLSPLDAVALGLGGVLLATALTFRSAWRAFDPAPAPGGPQWIYQWLPWALGGFLLLAGLTYGLARREERTSLGDEVGRAIVTAIPLSVYTVILMVALCAYRGPQGQPLVLIGRLRQTLVLPPALALPASAWLLCTLAVLAVRLQQPRLPHEGDLLDRPEPGRRPVKDA